MSTEKPDGWLEYHEKTKDKPPSKLLQESIVFVKPKGKVIDIGGGALSDVKYLLEQGFDVTVIDQEEKVKASADALGKEGLHAVTSTFADFDFPENTFDLASAMYTLPFNPPETFDRVFENIKHSLTKDGIFCGQFFGIRDGWSNNPTRTFHTREKIESLLSDMETISLIEEETDGKIANGTPKHWHVFHFIARKR